MPPASSRGLRSDAPSSGRLSRNHRRSSRACIFHGPRSAATSRRTSTFEHRFARRRRRRKSQRNRAREPAVARQGRRRSARAIAKRISYRWIASGHPTSSFSIQISRKQRVPFSRIARRRLQGGLVVLLSSASAIAAGRSLMQAMPLEDILTTITSGQIAHGACSRALASAIALRRPSEACFKVQSSRFHGTRYLLM
jgi:hypothetical protein